jgi:hypothetical protein
MLVMKRRIYLVSALVFFLLALLFAAQIFLSPHIERKIEEKIKEELNLLGVELSLSACNVNLLRRNVTLDKLRLQWQGNNFKTSRVEVSFSFLSLLLRRAICLIEIDKGELNIINWEAFTTPLEKERTVGVDVYQQAPAETDFFIRKLRVNNLFVRIKDDIEIPDLNLKVLLENIGMNKEGKFFIETTQTPFWIELKGDVELPNWKEHLAFNVRGKDIPLKPFVPLQDKFSPEEPSVRLTDGKASLVSEGRINNGMIQSLSKISISEFSIVTREEKPLKKILPESLREILLKPLHEILPESLQEILPKSFFEDLPEHFLYEAFFETLEEALLYGFTAGQTIEISLEIDGSLAAPLVKSNVSLGPITQ